MRHGYYAARKQEQHGDPVLATLAEIVWTDLGHLAPSVVDGVAFWIDAAGALHIRIAALDLFNPDLRVIVRDVSPDDWSSGLAA